MGEKSRLLSRALLESAVARPQASAFGEDAYPALLEKAAALLHSLCRNHAFVDGNKRTATTAVIDFLQINGFQIIWQPEDALEFILAVAQGQHDVPHIAEWLHQNTIEINQKS